MNPMNHARPRRRRVSVALAGVLAGLLGGLLGGCGPMTPAQQEAAELRQYCAINPGRNPERCMLFLNPPGL